MAPLNSRDDHWSSAKFSEIVSATKSYQYIVNTTQKAFLGYKEGFDNSQYEITALCCQSRDSFCLLLPLQQPVQQ